MNKLLIIAAIWMAGQFTVPFAPHPQVSAGCTPPTVTSRWAGSNNTGTNNCGSSGTSPCTNGSVLYYWIDSVGGNTAGPLFGASSVHYVTGVLNSLPAANFPGSSYSQKVLSTPIPTSIVSYSFAATFDTLAAWTAQALFGPQTSVGGISWSINSSGKQRYALAPVLVAPRYFPLARFTRSRRATTRQLMPGPSRNAAAGLVRPMDRGQRALEPPRMQSAQSAKLATGVNGLNGNIVEIDYYNGSSITGEGAWSYCQYGV